MQAEQTPVANASQQAILSIANNNPHVLQDYRQVVFEQYKMRGWLDPSQYPDGQVIDEFDLHADVLVVQSGTETVAGMRIVRDSEKGFPHENLLDLSQFRPDGY